MGKNTGGQDRVIAVARNMQSGKLRLDIAHRSGSIRQQNHRAALAAESLQRLNGRLARAASVVQHAPDIAECGIIGPRDFVQPLENDRCTARSRLGGMQTDPLRSYCGTARGAPRLDEAIAEDVP